MNGGEETERRRSCRKTEVYENIIKRNKGKQKKEKSRGCSRPARASPPSPSPRRPEPGYTIDTRGKSNAEFRNEVNEALARHESNFDQVNGTLQTILTELQALRVSRSPRMNPLELNPFAPTESSGLRDDIRLDVKIKHPTILFDTIGVVRLIEERNQLQKRVTHPYQIQPTATTAKTSMSNTVEFIPGHRCQQPQLFMICDTNDQDSMEQSELLQVAEDQKAAVLEISFHAIAGTAHPQTLWVMGRLRSKEVMVLIDSGSTHNFIDQSIVNKYELPVVPNKKFQVTVANGEKIDCTGLCPSLTIMIQGQIVTTDYFILPVAVCPVVLGV
uniref:Uncharacterized protein n=1 Tax=Populus alba TaxID=43335 RepID=A0A4U5NMI1_POPAL|nr:hypothetical protein D5086_0000254370 [Populus alba]